MATTVLDLSGLDGDDRAGLMASLQRIRTALARGHRVVVHDCPQMLAHNLYKLGLLDSDAVVLQSVRDDEPYG